MLEVYLVIPSRNKSVNIEVPKVDVSVKNEELENLSLATRRLWVLDINRFVPGRDYKINLQHSKLIYNKEDVADEPLFKGVDKNKFFATPTFKAFYALLDNYEHEAGKAEVITPQEIAENWAFINAICATPCMKYCHNYLVAKKKATPNMEEFKKTLYDLWFKMYRRVGGKGSDDSSGFEHVFVGEIREGKVIGFHNWIQFFLEERKGLLDYQGFVAHKRNAHVPPENEQLITIQFIWNTSTGEVKKDVSSTFVGSSPEFEVALYTLCFLIDSEEDHFCKVGEDHHLYDVNIKCHRWHCSHNPDRIACCFPVALDEY